MKSIVVPINFSACAANAARYAADLALVLKADIHLIHVIQVPVDSADLLMTEDLYQEMIDAANLDLQTLQSELTGRTQQKIKVDYSVESGNIAAKVQERCLQLKPYAVVLGATGSTLEKFLVTSPVSSLLRKLDYPVLIVPEGAAFHNFRHILLACDLDDIGSGMPNSLPLLNDLRAYFGSRFDIVTVETERVPGDGASPFASGGWKEAFKDLHPAIHCIHKPKVEAGILEYLAGNEADLVIVFPKKHGFLDFHTSQSRKLAEHSPVPVLSLHA
jgi:nucleotide-binding universal stress UspA family protein